MTKPLFIAAFDAATEYRPAPRKSLLERELKVKINLAHIANAALKKMVNTGRFTEFSSENPNDNKDRVLLLQNKREELIELYGMKPDIIDMLTGWLTDTKVNYGTDPLEVSVKTSVFPYQKKRYLLTSKFMRGNWQSPINSIPDGSMYYGYGKFDKGTITLTGFVNKHTQIPLADINFVANLNGTEHSDASMYVDSAVRVAIPHVYPANDFPNISTNAYASDIKALHDMFQTISSEA